MECHALNKQTTERKYRDRISSGDHQRLWDKTGLQCLPSSHLLYAGVCVDVCRKQPNISSFAKSSLMTRWLFLYRPSLFSNSLYTVKGDGDCGNSALAIQYVAPRPSQVVMLHSPEIYLTTFWARSLVIPNSPLSCKACNRVTMVNSW